MKTTQSAAQAPPFPVAVLADPWATHEEIAAARATLRRHPAHTCQPDLRGLRDRAFADLTAVVPFAAGLGWCGERRAEAERWIEAALSLHDAASETDLTAAEGEARAARAAAAHAAAVAAAAGRLSRRSADDLEPAILDAAEASGLCPAGVTSAVTQACHELGIWPSKAAIRRASTQARHAAAAWSERAPLLTRLDELAAARAAAAACLED